MTLKKFVWLFRALDSQGQENRNTELHVVSAQQLTAGFAVRHSSTSRQLALSALSGLNPRSMPVYTSRTQSLFRSDCPSRPGLGCPHIWHQVRGMRIPGHANHKALQRLKLIKSIWTFNPLVILMRVLSSGKLN